MGNHDTHRVPNSSTTKKRSIRDQLRVQRILGSKTRQQLLMGRNFAGRDVGTIALVLVDCIVVISEVFCFALAGKGATPPSPLVLGVGHD